MLLFEFGRRWRHPLVKPQAASPDEAFAAEVRALPVDREASVPAGVSS